jgi:hypothetical protein
MAYFQNKNLNSDGLSMVMLAIWNTLRPFGIFCGILVYFMVIWYILWHFVLFMAFWYILWHFGIFYGILVYFMAFWYIL